MAAATRILAAREAGIRIVFIDETTFTSQTIASKAWAHRDAPIGLSDKSLKCGRLNMLMGVSEDRGIDSWMTTTNNLSSDFTIEFLENIAASNCGKVLFFLDNASFHRAKRVGIRAAELGIELLFNAAYSPAYNPIELAFGPIKHYYKQERLRLLHQNLKLS